LDDPFDAILIVGFGGPEKREDIVPFLENVLRGRNVPRERMLEVAAHYERFDGISPINQQVRDLIDVLRTELDTNDVHLPIYWGNRNWHPMLPDTMQQMADAGVKRALALVLSAYSSYSSCRQYREDIERAQSRVGESAPTVEKIRAFYNHPGFVGAAAENLDAALEHFTPDELTDVHVAYTAHSLPTAMADACDYVSQLSETCRLVSEEVGIDADRWRLVYQSRSGRPSDPWLEPDICDHLSQLSQRGIRNVVVMPVGFLSDHIEVLYDLDDEARRTCVELGMKMVRASTVGTHPRFVSALRELISERLRPSTQRIAVGHFEAAPDECPLDCCPAPPRAPHRPRVAGSS